MTLTRNDVAKYCDVSPSTVSNVMNNMPNVSEKVRDRVLRGIEKLGYVPNEAAKRLRMGIRKGAGIQKTLNIGCIIKGEYVYSEPYFSRILEGISLGVNEAGYNLSFVHTIKQLLEVPGLFVRKINRQNIDGLVLIDFAGDKEIFDRLKQKVGNIVCLNISTDSDVDCIDVDKFQAGYRAVEYLYGEGHRRIGFIGNCASPEMHLSGRFKGYLLALQELRLEFDRSIVEGRLYKGVEEGYAFMAAVLGRTKNPPTAVFADSDLAAIGAMRAVRETGLEVPRDISFVSFDDINEAGLVTPALTTFRVNKEEMGKLGVKRLVERIENPGISAVKTILPVELVIRESVKAIAGSKE